MIEYIDKRTGSKVDLLVPGVGTWLAMVGEHEVAEIDVPASLIADYCFHVAVMVWNTDPAASRVVCDFIMNRTPETAWAVIYRSSSTIVEQIRRARAPEAVEWAAVAAASACFLDEDSEILPVMVRDVARWGKVADVKVNHMTSAMHWLAWGHHISDLTINERIELARDLRYLGENETAWRVTPFEYRRWAR